MNNIAGAALVSSLSLVLRSFPPLELDVLSAALDFSAAIAFVDDEGGVWTGGRLSRTTL